MVGQCRRSGSGLWYQDYAEFEKKTLELIQVDQNIAQNAREFVKSHYSWDSITAKYARLTS